MRHALLEYERNGYNDSDFFVVYFDDEALSIDQLEIGSTRYAGGSYGDVHKHPGLVPPDVLEKARLTLSQVIFRQIRAAEHRDVLEPESAPFGEALRILKDSGPRSKSQYKAGEAGEVFYSEAMGTFYRKGYNKPGRENIRVGLRLADGRRVFAPLKNCRLDREVMTDEELAARAEELSHGYNFGAAVGGYTWASQFFYDIPPRQKEVSTPSAGAKNPGEAQEPAKNDVADRRKQLVHSTAESVGQHLRQEANGNGDAADQGRLAEKIRHADRAKEMADKGSVNAASFMLHEADNVAAQSMTEGAPALFAENQKGVYPGIDAKEVAAEVEAAAEAFHDETIAPEPVFIAQTADGRHGYFLTPNPDNGPGDKPFRVLRRDTGITSDDKFDRDLSKDGPLDVCEFTVDSPLEAVTKVYDTIRLEHAIKPPTPLTDELAREFRGLDDTKTKSRAPELV